jgi:hypothetical protein
MKAFFPTGLSRRACVGVIMILVTGCALHQQCPSNLSDHYVDHTNGFSLCLPGSVTKGNAGGYPSGSVLFTGFPVPQGTNLEEKRLAIVPGTDPDMQDATAGGHFTADGVTFTRSQAGDGSAGHLTQYIIYTWNHGGTPLHFGFSLYSVNVNVYPPSSRPAQFDFAAQLHSTEEVMSTFRRTH